MITGLDLGEVDRRLPDVNRLLAMGATPGAVTIGLAQLEPHETVHALIARADVALYRARPERAAP